MKLSVKLLIVGWGIIVASVLSLVETASYLTHKFIVIPKAKFLSYRTPDPIPELDFNQYMRIRDPRLGWPTVQELDSKRHDISGSRPIPNFPIPGNEYVSTYGDSFVYANEVNDTMSWANVLSELMNRRVANFGVGGYGTDQALLRFENNDHDKSKITLLGILPDNILRNVNQNRFLMTMAESPLTFKPRFILENGGLRLIDLPKMSYQEFNMFLSEPKMILKYETFLPGTKYGAEKASFPFTLSLVRMIVKERFMSWLEGKPSWESFFQPQHPTQSLEITTAIIRTFRDICKKRDKIFLVILFPTPNSYRLFLKSGRLATELLIRNLEMDDIQVLDLTKPISEKLNGESFCNILARSETCDGHFNARGNRIIAEILYDYFKLHGMIVAPSQKANQKGMSYVMTGLSR